MDIFGGLLFSLSHYVTSHSLDMGSLFEAKSNSLLKVGRCRQVYLQLYLLNVTILHQISIDLFKIS